jgi:hypothetical protein
VGGTGGEECGKEEECCRPVRNVLLDSKLNKEDYGADKYLSGTSCCGKRVNTVGKQ